MDAHLGDIANVLQPQVLPSLARVGGFVDAVAMRNVAADGGFAQPRVEHIGIGRRHCKRAHRGAPEVAVGDILPVDAAICSPPDATARRAKVKDLLMHWVAGHRHHPSAAERSDKAPLHCLEPGWVYHWLHFLHFLCLRRPRVRLWLASLTLRCHLMPLSCLALLNLAYSW